MAKFTTTDLQNLKEALMSGAQSATVGDRNIQFRSIEDLLKLIDMVEKDLAGESSEASQVNTSVIIGGFSRKGSE